MSQQMYKSTGPIISPKSVSVMATMENMTVADADMATMYGSDCSQKQVLP